MIRAILTISFLLLSSFIFGQKQENYKGFEYYTHNSKIKVLEGNWGVNKFIVNSEITESFLFPLKANSYYVNKMTFNANQTFVGSRRMGCGFGCALNFSGKYKVIDEHYVCFYIENNRINGRCLDNENITLRKDNDDLGIYFYYRNEDGGLNLIRSKGDIVTDKQNAQYCEILKQKNNELHDFGFTQFNNFREATQLLFSWEETHLTDKNEIIAHYLKSRNIKNYEILYSLDINPSFTWTTFLLKINNKFEYIICGENEVALFNNTAISEIDSTVQKIENYKNLKSKTYKRNSSDRGEIKLTVFKSNNKILKIKYHVAYKDSKSISSIIYLQNNEPIYLTTKYKYHNNQESIFAYYIFDWKNKKISKRYIKNGFGTFDSKAIASEIMDLKIEIEKLINPE